MSSAALEAAARAEQEAWDRVMEARTFYEETVRFGDTATGQAATYHDSTAELRAWLEPCAACQVGLIAALNAARLAAEPLFDEHELGMERDRQNEAP